MTWRTIGARIKARRERRGWTQAVLADRAGVSRIYVQKIENGTRTPPLPTLERLARALGLRLADLVK